MNDVYLSLTGVYHYTKACFEQGHHICFLCYQNAENSKSCLSSVKILLLCVGEKWHCCGSQEQPSTDCCGIFSLVFHVNR